MRRLGLFIACSLGFHALLLGSLVEARRVSPVVAREPVRFKVTVEPSKVSPRAPSAPAAAKAASAVPSKRRLAPAAPSIKASAPSSGAEIKTYADLFPKASEGDLTPPSAPSAATGAPTFDPEGDAYAFAVQAKSLARLEGFARELAERVRVPFGVTRLKSSGKAFVRINRVGDGGWRVVAASGEPFFRAILYEALAEIPPESFLAMLLNDTDYPSVRIYFDLASVSSLDLTAKPIVTRTAANKVFLDYTHGRPDPAWMNAAAIDNAQGDDAVGWNMLGTGMYVWQKLHERDPNDDPDVLKLRLSPAFVRPIGR